MYGVLYAAHALWEELGIGPLLREKMQQDGCDATHETALFAMTVFVSGSSGVTSAARAVGSVIRIPRSSLGPPQPAGGVAGRARLSSSSVNSHAS